MTEELTPEQIIESVTNSGYLMEQEVASLLEDEGFVVSTNWAFRDQDQGTSRELDVHAFLMPYQNREVGTAIAIQLLCECKNSTAPLVFIGRNKSKADKHHVPLEYVFPFDDYEKEQPCTEPNQRRVWCDPPWRHLNLSRHHYFYSRDDKAVQFCRICRNGKKIEANHGGVYESLVYPLVKAVTSERTSVINMRKYTKGHVALFFPVVVVKGPLYYIDSRESHPVATPVPHISLMRNFDSEKIKGSFLIDFVTEGSLVDFVRDKVMRFAGALVDIASEKPMLLQEKVIREGEWDGILPE